MPNFMSWEGSKLPQRGGAEESHASRRKKRKPMKASPFGGEREPANKLNASAAQLPHPEAWERGGAGAQKHTRRRSGAGYGGDSEAGILSGISRKCRMRSGFY